MPFRRFIDPQLSLSSLQDEINRAVQRVWHGGISTGPFDGQQWGPPIDLYEHADRYTLFVELPGVDANDVEVTHVGTTLTIRGEKRRPLSLAEKDQEVHSERRFGSFSRTIDLPGDVDAEQLTARASQGILEVTLPKSEASKPKSVKVQAVER